MHVWSYTPTQHHTRQPSQYNKLKNKYIKVKSTGREEIILYTDTWNPKLYQKTMRTKEQV